MQICKCIIYKSTVCAVSTTVDVRRIGAADVSCTSMALWAMAAMLDGDIRSSDPATNPRRCPSNAGPTLQLLTAAVRQQSSLRNNSGKLRP